MIQELFKTAVSEVVLTNQEYNFEIIHLISKSPDLQVLYTKGMSSYLQPVNESNKELEHIELYFLLPEYWDLKKNNWPVYWLNRIAQVPQKNKTWFGIGDTLPAGNPPKQIEEKLKTSYFILSEPIFLDQLKTDGAIKYLAVIPIFRKEFDFKMQNSAALLFNKLKEKNHSEMVDQFRQPVARKRFMGVF